MPNIITKNKNSENKNNIGYSNNKNLTLFTSLRISVPAVKLVKEIKRI